MTIFLLCTKYSHGNHGNHGNDLFTVIYVNEFLLTNQAIMTIKMLCVRCSVYVCVYVYALLCTCVCVCAYVSAQVCVKL